MERRDFLRVLPVAALATTTVADGVKSVELPKDCHLLIIADINKVDHDAIMALPSEAFPKGTTGGYVMFVNGNPDEAIKFYSLKES